MTFPEKIANKVTVTVFAIESIILGGLGEKKRNIAHNFFLDSTTINYMKLLDFLKRDTDKHTVLASGHVVPDSARCVQCGICTYNCPIGIDVRAHAWRGEPIINSKCLTCGECVARCPRGVLRFEQTDLFASVNE